MKITEEQKKKAILRIALAMKKVALMNAEKYLNEIKQDLKK